MALWKSIVCVLLITVTCNLSGVRGGRQNDEQVGRGLFPHVFNLATRAVILSNATCGETKSEIYCHLVEHVPDQEINFPQCRVCDLNSNKRKERHPIENAIDGTNSWWQSPSIANGMQYHWVTITLDLGQIFQVAYVILKAANSPRPGNWILEKSVDGTMYEPWQFYAISDAECLRAYGKTAAVRMEEFTSDDEVICTSYYSSLEPLRDGEIHTSLINGRPSALNPSPTLMDFMSARFIRFRFQRIRTLNADLMSPLYNTVADTTDAIVSRRYFYSIKDISVGGHCICHGHALECVDRSETSQNQLALRCICQHNTCGESCNECCPGYHQKAWKPGNYQNSFACKACNCHNHADDCFYDPQVEADGLSLDAEFKYDGGGVCIDCRDHTIGINCEQCEDGYFRQEGVLPEYPEPCTECDCSPVGTISDKEDPSKPAPCVKDDRQIDIGVIPGSCPCKEGFAGTKCYMCARGYRGYPNCKPCPCSAAGSINEDPCEGPCICKPNVEGKRCNRCKEGTFNLNERDPLGCTMCFCFGITTQCTSVPWPMEQVNTMNNWFVTTLDMMGYAYADRISTFAILADHQSISQQLASQQYYFLAPREYVGNKLTAYGGVFQFTLSWRTTYDVPASNITRRIVIILESHQARLARWFTRNPLKREDTISFTMTEESWYHIPRSVNPLESTPGPPSGTQVNQSEFMNVLTQIRRLMIGALQNPPQIDILLKDVSMDVVTEESRSSELLKTVEECSCPATYEGLSCERCRDGFRRTDGILYGGDCEMCDCHGHSNTCDVYTGECLNCQDNTVGAHCEHCAPGFYPSSVNASGSPISCQQCACPLVETTNNFSPTCTAASEVEFVCDQCPPGYEGDKCERCIDGYFGNPLVLGETCKPCFVNCNGNVDPSLPGNCDSITGECRRCVNNTGGSHCERCADGYYGDAIELKDCKRCECDPDGSVSSVCDHGTGQCFCDVNVIGRSCDICEAGFWDLVPGLGCQPCSCNSIGSLDGVCDTFTGQCRCKEGVGGLKCNRCQLGFWRFSSAGCKVCTCDRGQCNPATGECFCPPNTVTPACQECAPNMWGFQPLEGCMPCNCSESTSLSTQCHQETGKCKCQTPYTGRRCDQCPNGYGGFPVCQPCKCNLEGTEPSSCKGKRCNCAQNGQCTCKENVRGLRCNKCKNGFFSLQGKVITGCTSCFCFGVTNQCHQASYIYSKLKVDSESVSEVTASDISTALSTQDGFQFSGSDVRTNITHIASILGSWEIYWTLPPSFAGSKVTSYGGSFKYKVTLDDFVNNNLHTSAVGPYLVLVGSNMTLEGAVVMKERGIAELMFKIELLEQHFLKQNTDIHPNRMELMMVLADLKSIYIRANISPNVKTTILSKVSMDIGVPGTASENRPEALGVELCRCPRGYTGTSCEKCAFGYVRVSDGPYLGSCTPCKCNRHSTECEEGSGHCVNCQDNTAGPRCEICAPGFYGDARLGTASDCQRCACPMLDDSNNFSPTCQPESDGQHRCTACQEGYQGRFCERCADGYYGNPLIPGSSCLPCECSEFGAVSLMCNRTNGLCHCKEGVIGDRCNECLQGFVLKQDGCLSCFEDQCSGLLLEEFDAMQAAFNLSFDTSSFILLPWSRYLAVYNQSRVAITMVEKFSENITGLKSRMKSSSKLLSRRQKEAAKLMEKKDTLKLEAETVAMVTSGTHQRGVSMERNITYLVKKLNDTISNLNTIMRVHGGRLPMSSNEDLLREGRKILVEIRRRTFRDEFRNSRRELRNAESLLQRVLSAATNLSGLDKAIGTVTNSIGHFTDMIGELVILTLTSESAIENSTIVSNRTTVLLGSWEDHMDELEYSDFSIQSDIKSAGDFLNESIFTVRAANMSLQESFSEWRNISAELKPLHNMSAHLKADIPALQELVRQAENHSGNLWNLSLSLESLLMPTKKFADKALKAARAYSDIVNAILEADNTSLGAALAANAAFNETVLHDDMTLMEVATSVSNISKEQLITALGLLRRALDVQGDIKHARKSVKRVHRKLDKIERELGKIVKALPRLESKDIGSRTDDVYNKSVEVFSQSEVILNQSNIVTKQLISLKADQERIAENVRAVGNDTNKTDSEVDQGRATLENIYSVTAFLDNKASHIKTMGSKVKGDLAKLREKIRLAKNEASKIRLSLHSSGNCSRVYRVKTAPSAYNSLVLMVEITRPNNQLFYVGGNTSDFFSVETIDYQVIFKWNVGSGVGVVSSTVIMDPGKWYRIEAVRVSQTGSLLVEEADNRMGTAPVSGAAPVGSTILDVNENSVMYIGGIPSDQMVDVVTTQNFEGCMGEVIFDGAPIGLWNFESAEGECQGCGVSPPTFQKEKGFGFDGTGYAMIRAPSSFRADVVYLAFDIRTLSQNALLFFMSSADQGDFVSIELKDGKPVTKLDLGEGVGIGESSEKINNNTWHSISLTIYKNESSLYINNRKATSAATKSSPDGLTISPFTKLYIGGLPYGFEMRRDVNVNSFRGCMRNFNLYRSTQDLLQPGHSFGITDSCTPNKVERSVGLSGRGSVALRPVALGREADITLTFTTLQEDAVILAAGDLRDRNKRDINFDAVDISYTFAIVHGLVQVQINAGQGRLTLATRKSDGKLNDGKPHVILMQKIDKRIRMTVDDKSTRSGKLPGTNVLIPARSPLYVGSLTQDISVSKTVQSLPPFSGCIENLVIMGELLSFTNATDFKNADIGFCGPLTLPPPPTTSLPLEGPSSDLTAGPNAFIKSCSRPETPEYIPYGLRFGITPHSYASVDIVPDEISKVFTMSIELRTIQEYGIIFYMADRSERNFCALFLMKGFVLFIFNIGTGPATILTDFAIDDGYWHVIQLTRNRKTGTIQVDSQNKQRVRTIGSASRLNVASPLYIGGVPEGFKIRQIGEESIGSFQGCIRKFELNDKQLDLPNVAIATSGTSLCYTNTQPGAFFTGDSYIIQEANLLLQRELNINLEFKTSHKEGVLFGLANKGNAYIILELKNFAINLRSSNGQETFLVTFNNPPVISLCDSQWHSVDVRVTLIQLELRVDGNNTIATHRMPGSAGGRYSLFAGGISDGFLQDSWVPFHGCLRNFSFNHSLQNFSQAVEIHRAVPDKCPLV
ncbi:Laminin subunit alpha-2 [Holothuria leucospilota]|uniref:Laminin subunit alpha-2 n=1 Tax=Holothuria leucospilota TaxID=206669 RepID=A0A9Q1BWF6_HOLLE|nr:Laminin subunit alpha-2 [Holothuria leucospilota]